MIHVRINPDDIFDRPGLTQALGLSEHTLGREVRLGRLKAYQRGKNYYYIGVDVLEWLRDGEVNGTNGAENEDQ